MMFVDGENFTMSFQRLAQEQNLDLTEGTHYTRNAFVWAPSHQATVPFTQLWSMTYQNVIATRAYFYTSLTGDEPALDALREKIWAKGFTPQVFKRPPKDRPSKGVDIALARDMLGHSFEDHMDLAVLVAGDADYLPLVEEVKRKGKRVMLAFFGNSTSLSPHLRRAADAFADVEPPMTNAWREFNTQQIRLKVNAPAVSPG